ncbi:hypothetical protein K432DRAFT_381939 [Lepidopterella palustris CBS 459.81]|uniref:F-box domain-containing protein n=1 Tax=Lepidopterella palustris CBS 459.81 TaxID=1314670 RepID=A0A8E2EB29_9PEZI|nr:hypothetical protein K432DRAFT_381939 [Lepidopterella palustris CBS 459.81]
MAERILSLTNLPIDILVLVLPYLDASSFLNLCVTCKGFQNSIRLDSTYWSHATRTTFRVPNQPVVQSDGQRWYKMYRRLFTQSKVFTWGSNTHQCLGHSSIPVAPTSNRRGILRPRFTHAGTNAPYPKEMKDTADLGIISDMQCGGWSTTLLTSKGQLYTFGVLDGLSFPHVYGDNGTGSRKQLKYPLGFPQSSDRYESSVAIRQFSSGRSHVLGLSDSGRIWSWYDATQSSLHVKFLHIDINEDSANTEAGPTGTEQSRLAGRVRKVVAGWSLSSAYIYGTGIILWSPVRRPHGQDDLDTMLVMASVVVPKTNYQRRTHYSRESDQDHALGEEVGSVVNFLLLEHFVVFATDIGKVFSARIFWDGDDGSVPEIMELKALRNGKGTASDVQGSFRSFAVFKNGEVTIAYQSYLEACWESRLDDFEQNEIPGLMKIPALQHKDVISVAFGDYHFHALHSTGHITSYGKEPQGCGTLGLGGPGPDDTAHLRGVQYSRLNVDGNLIRHAYTNGRQVWFEPEKWQWMKFMSMGGKDLDEAKDRRNMVMHDEDAQGEVSEWFEQEGRDWDKHAELQEYNEDGLGAYFALSISAAGWHSGALVLVNENLASRLKAWCTMVDPPSTESKNVAENKGNNEDVNSDATPTERARRTNIMRDMISPGKGLKYRWANDSFPRLQLSDGREMPGQIPFSEWKYGRPRWQLNIDI